MKINDKKFWDELHKRFNMAAKEFAEEFAFKVQEEYEKTMEYFYNDEVFPTVNESGYSSYTNSPRWYNRTYSLYRASSGYYTATNASNVTPIENGYLTGITVDPKNIPNDTYKIHNSDYVFRRAYNAGIHGIGPLDKKNKAKVKSYSGHIKVTIPYPKTFMNQSFKTITKKKYLRDMQNRIFKKYF